MHVLETLEDLIDDILLVDVFQNVCSNYRVQISVHEVKDQVNVSVVFSAYHILEPNYVFVASQLLQEDDLTESSLSVCCILESIKVLLEGHDFLCSLVDSLPHDTVGTLT